MLMIIDFNHSFKDYNDIFDFYGIWEYECPKCGAHHSFCRHAKYSRSLILWDTDHLCETRMEILRLQCGSCKSTHAILTMDMIPFCIYSLQAFLVLVTFCIAAGGSVPKTEQKTGVSYQMLYRFLLIFHEFYDRLCLFLRIQGIWDSALQPLPREILPLLCSEPPPWLQNGFFRESQLPLFLHRKSTGSYPFFCGAKLLEDPATHIASA